MLVGFVEGHTADIVQDDGKPSVQLPLTSPASPDWMDECHDPAWRNAGFPMHLPSKMLMLPGYHDYPVIHVIKH